MIFSRNRASGRHAKDDAARAGRQSARPDDVADDVDFGPDDGVGDDATDLGFGPYDATEAPDGIAQLDLGALRIPAVDGVEVRVQADPDGRIQQVVLVNGESALQIGAFAAPRSEGIWDEVRTEIRKQMFNDGVAAEEVDGDYGTELRARVRTPDGLTDIRFVGVDGPRWLVRAVYQGPAAVDPSAAPPLVLCLRRLVVDRGHEAMPVREPLPLRLPREIADQAQLAEQDGGGEAGAGQAVGSGEGAPHGAGGAPHEARTNGADVAAPPRRKPSPRPRRR